MLYLFFIALMACSGPGPDPALTPSGSEPSPGPSPSTATQPAKAPEPVPVPEPEPQPQPKPVTALALRFTGSIQGQVNITGTLSYEMFQGPIVTDLYGLHPNVGYQLTDFHFDVDCLQVCDLVQANVYDNTLGAKADFCLGNCVFGSGNVLALKLSNNTPYILLLVFAYTDPTPSINPPGTAEEWGVFLQGLYRVPCPICVPLSIINKGGIEDVNPN